VVAFFMRHPVYSVLPYLAMVENPSILSWMQMLIRITTKI